jgi:hypothetical protein
MKIHLSALLVSVCFLQTPVFSQVTAGNTFNLSFQTDLYNEIVNISAFPPIFGNDDNFTADSLDLDRNGQFDFLFTCISCNTFDCKGGYTRAGILHQQAEFMVDDDGYIVKLAPGDSIDANRQWAKLTDGILIDKFNGIGGNTQIGNWTGNPEGFAGIRLIAATDTLYGWLKITAAANANTGSATVKIFEWAIELGDWQIPFIKISVVPDKDIYCPGDTVTFQAVAVGADQFAWELWDGSVDSSLTAVRVLPAMNNISIFRAYNQNGVNFAYAGLSTSALTLEAGGIELNCLHPVDTLIADVNVPADVWWVVGNDIIYGEYGSTGYTGPIQVFARDDYGCVVSQTIVPQVDTTVPDVTIIYDEANHLLIAQSSVPGVFFYWSGGPTPMQVLNDTAKITESGTYVLVAIPPNGCDTLHEITVVVSSITTPAEPGYMLVTPNPASDALRIENRYGFDIRTQLFDASGSVWHSKNIVQAGATASLDVADLPAGIYNLAIYNPDGILLRHQKVIIQ